MKPVVLFFASYSCLCSQESAPLINSLHKAYGHDFQFALVYIREAHPSDGFLANTSGREFSIPDTKSFHQRVGVALKFAFEQKIKFPVLVDSMDDLQAVQWSAWPARLYVINQTGTVVYAGQQGPWFVKPTPSFDLKLHSVSESYRNILGYSQESLEEFLKSSRQRRGMMNFNQ
ncbi:MAG: deiodinase-like protein [Verrucomicrobiales bacterium]